MYLANVPRHVKMTSIKWGRDIVKDGANLWDGSCTLYIRVLRLCVFMTPHDSCTSWQPHTLEPRSLSRPFIHPRSFNRFNSTLFSLKNKVIFAKSQF